MVPSLLSSEACCTATAQEAVVLHHTVLFACWTHVQHPVQGAALQAAAIAVAVAAAAAAADEAAEQEWA